MLRTNNTTGNQVTLLLRHCDGKDTLSTTLVNWILRNCRTLSVALLGNNEKVTVAVGNLHAKHSCIALERDTTNARGTASHASCLCLVKQNCLTVRGAQNNLVTWVDTTDVNKLVAILKVDCNEAVLTGTVVLRHCCLLDHSLLSSKHQVVIFWEVAGSNDCLDLLALCKCLDDIDDSAALCSSTTNRKFVDLEAIHLTKVGKEQHVIVGRSNKEVLDKIVLFERDALNTLAAALLRAINLNRNALYVTCVSNGNNHVLFSDKILDVQVLNVLVGDLRTTLVSVTVGNLTELIGNNSQNLFLVSEKILVVGNIKSELGNLVNKILTSKTGEAAQTHLKDCLALNLIQAKTLVHALLCLSIILRAADDVDNLVDVINCGQKAFQNVDTLLRLIQVKLSTTAYNINLVINVVTKNLAKRKGTRNTVNQGQVNDAKVGLKLSLLV